MKRFGLMLHPHGSSDCCILRALPRALTCDVNPTWPHLVMLALIGVMVPGFGCGPSCSLGPFSSALVPSREWWRAPAPAFGSRPPAWFREAIWRGRHMPDALTMLEHLASARDFPAYTCFTSQVVHLPSPSEVILEPSIGFLPLRRAPWVSSWRPSTPIIMVSFVAFEFGTHSWLLSRHLREKPSVDASRGRSATFSAVTRP